MKCKSRVLGTFRSWLILSALLYAAPNHALVNCGPTSCNPPCNGSCNYALCNQASTQQIKSEDMTYDYVPASNACQAPPAQAIHDIPTTLTSPAGSVTLRDIKIDVAVPITICRTYTNYGPPCPP